MTSDSTFCFEGNEDFYVEQGIFEGYSEAYLITDYTNYGELIIDRLEERPDFVGQIDAMTGKQETFGMMLEKSVKCAIWLKDQNVRPGDTVAICTHIQMDMYVPCFATLYVGAVLNPWWDFGLTDDVTKHFLNLTEPKIVFVDEASVAITSKMVNKMGMKTKIVVIGNAPGFQSLENILRSVDEELVPEYECARLASVDEPALIYLTSGTTGMPKGALHGHRSLFGNVTVAELDCSSGGVSTALNFSKLPWVSGIITMLRATAGLERRIIYPTFEEEKTLQLIQKYQVNWMVMETSMAIRLQKYPAKQNYDLSSLKVIFVTGSVLKEDNQKAMAEALPHTVVLQTYGMSELGGATLQQCEASRHGSCGRLVKNAMMKVIDRETGRIVGPHEVGEACFKSPFVMKCYYKNPEETSKCFDSEGWFHTGDLVFYDEEGHVFVKDRIKEIIKYRGQYASPTMIEQLLQKHPGVRENAVFGVPHDTDGEHPMAFVAIMPNAEVRKDELEEMVAKGLPDHLKLRGGVKFLTELPHTASGKVDRSKLRKLAESYGA